MTDYDPKSLIAVPSHKSEKAWWWQDVEFIDMTSVASPSRDWL